MHDALEELAATWRTGIPLTEAMTLRPVSFENHRLVVRASLEPNVNVHGTAFAGSLYAVAALSGWGLVHLELQAAGLDASIVIAEGHISYRHPVQETIEASCATDAATRDSIMQGLRDAGRLRWPLEAVITAGGREAVRLEAVYAIKLRAHRPGDS